MAEQTSGRRRGLGRGLGALIVNTGPSAPTIPGSSASPQTGIHSLELERIAPNPQQPRTRFDEDGLLELAASIREHGIIQPLIVTQNPHETDAYWLVAGERRWRAARLAGLEQVPVLVREASPQQLLEWALVENVQRADLNALEEAAAYHTLISEFRLTQAEVAQRVGRSRSAVANVVRLLQLPEELQAAVIDEQISAGHARALLALTEPAAMERALAVIVEQDLSVRQTEELVRRLTSPPDPDRGRTPQEPLDDQIQAQIRDMENRFRTTLGTRVDLNRNADGSGRLVVHFFSDDDLQNLFDFLTRDSDQ